MATLGGYQTVQELARHGLGWVATAQRDGEAASSGPGRFVVKVFQPAVELAGAEGLRRASRLFLERARLQQDIAGGGAQHWAPIHDLGPTGQGAYYVGDYYPRSVHKLISGRVKLSPAAMHAIIGGVVEGLLELKNHAGRTHGQLKPSNIFLVGKAEIEQATVLLADPGPVEGLTNAKREQADVQAIGNLIYELVTHRPWRSANWPIAAGAEWNRLGNRATAWRQLANRLLDPNPAQPLTVDMVAEEIKRLRPGKRRLVVPLGLGVAVLLLGLLAAGGYWRYQQFKTQWRQLCIAYETWLYDFRIDLESDRQRLERIERFANLTAPVERIVGEKIELDPKRIAGNSMLTLSQLAEQPPASLAAIRRTDRALDVAQEIERGLEPSRWPLLLELTQRQRDYEQRQWTRQANYLKELTAGVSPPLKPDLAAAVDRLLREQAKLASDAAAIETGWRQISATEQLLRQKAGDDPLLKQFPQFVHTYLAPVLGGDGGGDALGELRAALAPLEELSRQLAAVVREDWGTKLDVERFAREGELYQHLSTASAREFQAWLNEAGEFYRFRLEANQEPVAGLLRLANDSRAGLARLRGELKAPPADVEPLSARLNEAAAKVSHFQGQTWVGRDQRLNRINDEAQAMRQSLQALARDVQRQITRLTVDQKQWWAELSADAVGASTVLNAAWTEAREKIIRPGELPLADVQEFERRQQAAEALKENLAALDELLPSPPALDAPYDQIAQAKREQMLGQLLASYPLSQGHTDYAALQQAGRRQAEVYAAWLGDLRQLAREFALAKGQLDGLLGLHDQDGALAKLLPAWRDKPVWNDVKDQPAVATVAQRIAELEQVELMSPDQLAQAAADKKTPDGVALAAYRRLMALEDWPATPQQLQAEVGVHTRVAGAIGAVPDRFRKEDLLKQWHSAPAARVARCLNRASLDALDATAKAALAAAPVLLPSLDPSPRGLAGMDGLDWPARYNLLLFGLRQTAASETDEQKLKAALAQFTSDLGQFPEPVRRRPEVTRALARLKAFDAPEPPAGPVSPWRLDSDDGAVRQYSLPNAMGAPIALRFHRVEAPGLRPFYLCETELSLTAIALHLSLANQWDQVTRLLWSYTPPDDPRPGVRVWEWTGSNPPLASATSWLRRSDRLLPVHYPDALRSGENRRALQNEPISFGEQLPMQYLSLPAARQLARSLNCRLPSAGEWLAAYEQFEKAIPLEQWNLRDQTFALQQRHVASLPVPENQKAPWWPDAGIFWPGDAKLAAERGPQARSRSANDRRLWFSPVQQGAGKVFKNLLGNVAEYVTAEDETQVRVIGASALSPPDLEPTRPYQPDPQAAALGFADVGLRLAFDVPAAGLAEKLKWTLMDRQIGYLPSGQER